MRAIRARFIRQLVSKAGYSAVRKYRTVWARNNQYNRGQRISEGPRRLYQKMKKIWSRMPNKRKMKLAID